MLVSLWRFLIVFGVGLFPAWNAVASSSKVQKSTSVMRWGHLDSYSPREENKQMGLELKFKQKGESFENSAESSFLYTIEGTPEFKLKLNKFTTFNSKVSVSSRIGSVQSRFGDLRSRSAIIIRDTRFKFFNQYINEKGTTRVGSYLSIGAIDQGGHHRYFSNFISSRALPGIEERVIFERKVGKGIYGFDFRGFQGIPTAQSDTLDFTEKEKTPTFLSTNIQGFYRREKQKNNFFVSANFGLFKFSSLPSSIADESRLYGNTVDFVGAAAEFRYKYSGWFGGWNAGFSRGKLSSEVGIQMLQNLDAPDKRNQAQKAYLKFKYNASRKYNVEFTPLAFFTESDASIASYNSLAGHNNREGYGLETTINLPTKKFKFKLTYTHSDLIETNSLQLEQDFIGLSLEYKNDFI